MRHARSLALALYQRCRPHEFAHALCTMPSAPCTRTQALASYQRCLDLVPDSRNAGQNRLLALNYIYDGACLARVYACMCVFERARTCMCVSYTRPLACRIRYCRWRRAPQATTRS